MSTQRPALSAILCTYNRSTLLRQALEALCCQTLPAERFEVIVIDDGSTDGTAQTVDGFRGLLPLQYIHQGNSGLAAAKNRGIDAASGDIVLFVDDDDVMDPDCLRQHLLTHGEYPQIEYAVLGYTDLATEVAASPLMRYVTEVSGQLFQYGPLQDGKPLDYTLFWGGRSSCKRELLVQHGNFNPRFRFGAEDIELGYRLSISAGLQVVFNRQAISHMVRTLSFDDFCRRCTLQGGSNRVFAQLHPQPEILRYTGVDDAQRQWPDIAPLYQQLLTVGRNLDRYATLRSAAQLPLDGISTRLLHDAYRAAFEASRIQGTVDSADNGI